MGRGQTLQRKMRPAIPPQVGEAGSANPLMIGLSLVHLRFTELAALMFKFPRIHDGAKLALQWSNITSNMRKPGRALISGTMGTIWEARVVTSGRLNIIDIHVRPALLQWASEAKAEAIQLKTDFTSQSFINYRRWIGRQIEAGAGALHRITKRVEPPIEDAVYVHTAKLPDTLSEERKKADEMKTTKAIQATRIRQPFPFKGEYVGKFCGGCGTAFETHRVWTMDARVASTSGLKELFCSSCGYRALPFLPSGDLCSCDVPPTTGVWCTDCGVVRTYLPPKKPDMSNNFPPSLKLYFEWN